MSQSGTTATGGSGSGGSTGTSPEPFERRRRRRQAVRRALTGLLVVAVVGVALWIVYGVGIDTLVGKIQNLPPLLVVALVFLLPALEASAFVGVVFPGEIVVLVGGVAASNGKVSVAAVLVAACLGAVIGDQIGYVVGREWGASLLRRVPDRLLDDERLERAQLFVRRAGAKGVIVGRWTAALRALVPGLAGMSRMHYPRFLLANVVGGVGWATVCVVLGYVAGSHFHTVEKALGNVSSILLVVIIAGLVARHFLHRRRDGRRSLEERLEQRLEERVAPSGADAPAAADAGPGLAPADD